MITCTVCIGYGGWYRESGQPTRERNADVMICLYCKGERKVPEIREMVK